MNFDQIVKAIAQQPVSHRPIIIGIDGFGGSGKSTFAEKLKVALGDAYVVPIDDFFIKDKATDADKSNFDRDRLERQVLMPIRDGQRAVYHKHSSKTDTPGESISVPAATYVIIEGVSSYHPNIEHYYDYKIFIDTPAETAKQRGSYRDKKLGDGNDTLWPVWTATYAEYKEIYKPDERADFILDNKKSAA